MKKIVLFLLFAVALVDAADYKIVSIKDEKLTIEAQNIPKGTSGVIIRTLNDQYETIISRVEVVESAEQTELKTLTFNDLYQEALPTLKTAPKVGDTVRLEWMHDRILLIAPSRESYEIVSKAQKNKIFLHPDLFAVALSNEGHPTPLKSDFQNFCSAYDVGVIEVIHDTKLSKVDCYSFKTLETIKAELPKTDIQTPFYSRVKSINADWWGEGSDEIQNYDAYYTKLLQE